MHVEYGTVVKRLATYQGEPSAKLDNEVAKLEAAVAATVRGKAPNEPNEEPAIKITRKHTARFA
jgi:hypothetical protein